jgi:hypothetical protein
MMQDMYVMYTTLYFYVVVTYSVIHCRLGWTLLVQIRSRQSTFLEIRNVPNFTISDINC